MAKVRNPFKAVGKILGLPTGRLTALKTTVENELRARDDQDEVDEAVLRALAPDLADDRVWNTVKAEMGL